MQLTSHSRAIDSLDPHTPTHVCTLTQPFDVYESDTFLDTFQKFLFCGYPHTAYALRVENTLDSSIVLLCPLSCFGVFAVCLWCV
jgi:hypothetical protein